MVKATNVNSRENVRVYLAPHLLEAPDGSPIEAEWGRLFVPENRTKPDSNLIEIPFVRLRSTATNPGTPFVYLAGGPGAEILSNLQRFLSSFLKFREIADFKEDLIVVEPRGVGHSRPCLDCPGTYNLPLDRPLSPEALVTAASTYCKTCVRFWEGQGVDLSGYNVREMAADINNLRQAFGYERISLLGGSFGSHHGLTMLKYYGEFIERAVLTGIEGPNHTIKLTSTIQNYLAKLVDMVKADLEISRRIPDFLELIASVLSGLEQEPVTVKIPDPDTGEMVAVTLGKFDLQLATASGMGTTAFLCALPVRYYAMSQGDFTWLAEWALRNRTNRRENIMNIAVDCASGASADRLARIEKETNQTLLGNAIDMPKYHMCDLLGDVDLGEEFRADVQSEVPVLLIGGSLDARTPISNANEVLKGLVKGQLLVIEGVSHDIESGGPEVVEKMFKAIFQFLKNRPLSFTLIKAPFKFDPIAASVEHSGSTCARGHS